MPAVQEFCDLLPTSKKIQSSHIFSTWNLSSCLTIDFCQQEAWWANTLTPACGEGQELFFASLIMIRLGIYTKHHRRFRFILNCFVTSLEQTWKSTSGKVCESLKRLVLYKDVVLLAYRCCSMILILIFRIDQNETDNFGLTQMRVRWGWAAGWIVKGWRCFMVVECPFRRSL